MPRVLKVRQVHKVLREQIPVHKVVQVLKDLQGHKVLKVQT